MKLFAITIQMYLFTAFDSRWHLKSCLAARKRVLNRAFLSPLPIVLTVLTVLTVLVVPRVPYRVPLTVGGGMPYVCHLCSPCQERAPDYYIRKV